MLESKSARKIDCLVGLYDKIKGRRTDLGWLEEDKKISERIEKRIEKEASRIKMKEERFRKAFSL